MKIKELWHRLGSPRWFFEYSGKFVSFFGVGALILLVVGFVWGLLIAPPDYQQGNSFRIIYVHVPAAILSQSLYLAMGAGGFVLYVWRMKLADVLISACLPLGMSLTVLALFSGAVWGKPTWVLAGGRRPLKRRHRAVQQTKQGGGSTAGSVVCVCGL